MYIMRFKSEKDKFFKTYDEMQHYYRSLGIKRMLDVIGWNYVGV